MTCMLVQCPYTSAVCMGFGCQYYIVPSSKWYSGKVARLTEFTDDELVEELKRRMKK